MASAVDVRAEAGPVLPSRSRVNFDARELVVLARRAAEFSTAGPGCNLSAALHELAQMRAILGGES